MIANKKGISTVKYIAVIRAGDEGLVLTVAVGDINRTVEHEKRIGSAMVGEFSALHVAERAVKQALRGWRQCPDARKTGT